MATQRAARGLTRPPLAGAWALAPAAIILGLLVAAGMGYAIAQSLGALPLAGETDVGFAAYRRLLADGGSGGDLWASAGFTLWISAASTLVAACLALLAVGWLDQPRRGRGVAAGVLHLNLAIPHVVWAVALVLVLSQSGIVARIAAAVGLVGVPADFPIVVRDRFGLGIVIHYATKEAPFLTLVAMALSRAQPRELGVIAQTLGATGIRRLRLVTLPVVLPGLAAASALVFAFVFGAYEAPVVVGVTSPRPLSVLGLDLFTSADLARRPEAMALGVLMAVAVVAILSVSIATLRRRSQ